MMRLRLGGDILPFFLGREWCFQGACTSVGEAGLVVGVRNPPHTLAWAHLFPPQVAPPPVTVPPCCSNVFIGLPVTLPQCSCNVYIGLRFDVL